MSGLEWNDELKLELLRLKSEITPQSLKILSPGIGLGDLSKKKPAKNPVFAEITSQQLQSKVNSPSSNLSSSDLKTQTTNSPIAKTAMFRLDKFGLIKLYTQSNLLDLLFVMLSILSGSILLSMFISTSAIDICQSLFLGELESEYTYLRPVLVGTVTMVMYRSFFRLTSGLTIGEFIVWPSELKQKRLNGLMG